ncbi:unnamed protein product [Rotaria socialis]
MEKLSFIDFLFLYSVTDATLNCSVGANELDLINLNPFFVRLNLSPNRTSVEYDTELQQIKKMIVVDNKNPSTNVFCLKNLRSLQLINTNLSLLPDISNLKNLELLQIESTYTLIKYYIPSEIGELARLSGLILRNIYNLTYLPGESGQWQSLTLAQLPSLQNIPRISMGNLSKLRALSLEDIPKLAMLPSPMENFQQLNTFI